MKRLVPAIIALAAVFGATSATAANAAPEAGPTSNLSERDWTEQCVERSAAPDEVAGFYRDQLIRLCQQGHFSVVP